MSDEERPGAEQWVPARPSLTTLREAVQDCRGCELYRDATHAVMGDGPRSADVMVLGEQPGDTEDIDGEPFVGPAGKVLDRALAEAGLPPAAVYRTNVVKHFHFSGPAGSSGSTSHPAAGTSPRAGRGWSPSWPW